MYYTRRHMTLEYLNACDATFHPLAKVVSTKSLCHKLTNFVFGITKYIGRGIWQLYIFFFFLAKLLPTHFSILNVHCLWKLLCAILMDTFWISISLIPSVFINWNSSVGKDYQLFSLYLLFVCISIKSFLKVCLSYI